MKRGRKASINGQRHTISVYVDTETKKKIEAYAQENGITLAEAIRTMIAEHFLASEEQQAES